MKPWWSSTSIDRMSNHVHTKGSRDYGNAFKLGITINLAFIATEVYFGFRSGSMALVADAGHNFSDVLALVFSWTALLLAKRKASLKFTYGLRRSTILIALLNTLILLGSVVWILWETIARFKQPTEVDSEIVILVGCLAVVVNGFTAWLFLKGRHHDLNIRSAFAHFVADALVSFGVVVGGLVIALTGIQWIDSIVSLLIIGIILYSTYRLLVDSVSLALDAVPDHIDIQAVRKYLEGLPQVRSIHDLHIWALGTSDSATTVHLATNVQTDIRFILDIQRELKDRFGIDHATIQVEYGNGEECGIEF